MRKAALLLAIVLIISVPLTVSAVSNSLSVEPHLSFEGSAAVCEVTIIGNSASERLEVTMKLMRGTTCVASWSETGSAWVHIKEYASVSRGTYDLVIEVTVNGVEEKPVSIRNTY